MSGTETQIDQTDLEQYQNRVSQPLVRLFSRYGRTHAQWLGVGIVANIVGHFASLAAPIILGITIDAVFTAESAYSIPLVPDVWLPTNPVAQFWVSTAIVTSSLVLAALLAWLRGYAMNLFAHSVMYEIRTDAFGKLQELDMIFFDEMETGEIMSILNNDTGNLERFFDNVLGESVRIAVLVAGISLWLMYTNWQLAVVTLGVIPLIALFTQWFVRAVDPRYRQQRKAIGNLNTRLENALSGIRLVKTFTGEQHEQKQVDRVSRDLLDADISVITLSVFYRPGVELLTGIALVATFVVGGLWVFSGPPLFFSGSLTVGEFVVFFLLTQRLVGPLARSSDIVDWYENARASGKRINGLIDIPPGIETDPEPTALETVEGRIEFNDVSFAYEEGQEILDEVEFSIDPGETIGVVGPSGSGKSTIAKLLVRLYEIDSGRITLDNHDIRELPLSTLRESVGYVGQSTFLFDSSVAENIRYGQADSTDEEIKAAARAAKAHKYIMELDDGYRTSVGERGVKLSGGQRQRIALARAVLKNPDVLVLDEATSDVDTETEVRMMDSLQSLMDDRTIISIAHRLSTIKDADRIFVVNQGRIVERGTHKELRQQGGRYERLWNIQTDRRGRRKPEAND